jgi:hypothetical protein
MFFEHPLGVSVFGDQIVSICSRKWSDLITTFGYPMELQPEPTVPPKLRRDIPWRKYLNHWCSYMEPMFVENCGSDTNIPAGNEVLGTLLAQMSDQIPITTIA